MMTYLTQDFQYHDQNIKGSNHEFPSFNIFYNQNSINSEQDKYSKETASIYPQQPIIDWYFIIPYATYYSRPSSISDDFDSNPTDDNEIDYSTNSNSQKIVVNVINDPSSSKPSTNSSKSNHKNKKGIYTSPNTIIGSQTMEDLYQVMHNQRSTSPQSTSMIKRVIIIDRENNNQTNSGENQLPSTQHTVHQPTYYNLQQPKMYTSTLNNIYLTTTRAPYVANMNSFYPFVYYRY